MKEKDYREWDSNRIPLSGLHSIELDQKRFRQIVRREVRKDLGKYIGQDPMIGKQGKEYISIPMPTLELPTFRYGNEGEQVGMGDGPMEPGDKAGEHLLEVEVDEVYEMLKEDLELPLLQPKNMGEELVLSSKMRGVTVSRTPFIDRKRSMRSAIAKFYDPRKPQESMKMAMSMVTAPGVAKYKTQEEEVVPTGRAVLILSRDVSGSMSQDKVRLIRSVNYWAELFLKKNYKKMEMAYVMHDENAAVVNKEAFYGYNSDGGTRISSAFEVIDNLIAQRYSKAEWNVYVMYGSDGENWDRDDTRKCMEMLAGIFLPRVRSFSFAYTPDSSNSGSDFYSYYNTMVSTHTPTDTLGCLTSAKMKEGRDVHGALLKFYGKNKPTKK